MTKGVLIVKVFCAVFTLFLAPLNAQESIIKQILWTAEFSPNGKLIAIGGNLDSLNIYKSKNLQLHKSYPISQTVTSVKWHPTKNIIAIGTQGSIDKVCILDIEKNRTIELANVSPDGARGIDWNFSGEYLAVADNDGKISIYDIQGNVIQTINQENTKSITAVDWHPTKDIFITVGDKIRIFDINGDLLNTIIHRAEETLLLTVAWHNSGEFFVTGDYGDHQKNYKPLLQFWSTNGDLISSSDISQGEYRNIKWNNNGTRLATASDALRLWDMNGNLILESKSNDYLWGLAWNKKGNRIITSSNQQKVVIWDKNLMIKKTL